MPTDLPSVPVAHRRPSLSKARIAVLRSGSRPIGRLLAAAVLSLVGCTAFEHPVERVAPTALGWLTNWNSQPLANTKPFDIETIRPTTRQPTLSADTLLEVTVWDLYEPGRPHTFPVRVSPRQSIEIPMLGEVAVAGRGLSEMETTLADEFRRRDLLKTPRILVRNLETGHVRVQVSGAVMRPGFVELSRDRATVYDALIAAGGLKNLAGTQISVVHRTVPVPQTANRSQPLSIIRGQSPVDEVDAAPSDAPRIRSARAAQEEPVEASVEEPVEDQSVGTQEQLEQVEPQADVAESEPKVATPRANRIEEVSVPISKPTSPSTVKAPASGNSSSAEVASSADTTADALSVINRNKKSPARPELPKGSSNDRTSWFDVSQESDRQALQSLILGEGDSVQVKGAAPPIRIAGSVARPGDYTLPAGRSLDLWQALDLAGGIKSSGTPLVITLLRPPGEGHGPQRWQQQLDSLDKKPTSIPGIQPGDVIDISPPTGTRLKKAVGGLWNH